MATTAHKNIYKRDCHWMILWYSLRLASHNVPWQCRLTVSKVLRLVKASGLLGQLTIVCSNVCGDVLMKRSICSSTFTFWQLLQWVGAGKECRKGRKNGWGGEAAGSAWIFQFARVLILSHVSHGIWQSSRRRSLLNQHHKQCKCRSSSHFGSDQSLKMSMSIFMLKEVSLLDWGGMCGIK